MAKDIVRVDVMHASMQFSDNTKQKAADTEAIFARAAARNVWWITGTEAGGGKSKDLQAALKASCKKYGYRFFHPVGQDTWIAVAEDRIEGKWSTDGGRTVVPAKAGRWTAKGIGSVSWQDPQLGTMNVAAGHYLTKGRPSAKSPEYRANLAANKAMALEIGAWATRVGKGGALAFYGGDQNIVDRTDDTFLGAPMTSLWDELGKYENTGHGNIDVIASYDRDGRVKGAYIRALDDSEFRLNTDHFLVEGGFDVRESK